MAPIKVNKRIKLAYTGIFAIYLRHIINLYFQINLWKMLTHSNKRITTQQINNPTQIEWLKRIPTHADAKHNSPPQANAKSPTHSETNEPLHFTSFSNEPFKNGSWL